MSTYDAVPYPSLPYPHAHPDRMAASARLFGVKPSGFRVLEIGCGSGGHLLSVAASIPESKCVGIDPSGGEIARARAMAQAAKLENVTFVESDSVDGIFDFVIAHGVLSWVSERARRNILALSRRCLAPDGVFYASYNVYPGWHLRGAMREAMRWRAGSDVVRARELLDKLDGRIEGGTAWRSVFDEEIARVRASDDAYLFHEHLETENHPCWFHEMAAEAREHGLHFLTEAEQAAVLHPQATPRAVAAFAEIAGDDPIAIEQAFDLVRGRSFRCSLFAQKPRDPSDADSDLVVVRREAPEYPDGRTISSLSSAGQIDTRSILALYASGEIELRARVLGLAPQDDPSPRTTSLARAQALRPGAIANLRGEPIPLSEEERQGLIYPEAASAEVRERLRRLAFLLAS